MDRTERNGRTQTLALHHAVPNAQKNIFNHARVGSGTPDGHLGDTLIVEQPFDLGFGSIPKSVGKEFVRYWNVITAI